MSDSRWPPSPDELIESHDTPEEVLETLQEQAPELPERFQDLSYQELLDMPISRGTDEEAEQLAYYLIWHREIAKRYDIAQERME